MDMYDRPALRAYTEAARRRPPHAELVPYMRAELEEWRSIWGDRKARRLAGDLLLQGLSRAIGEIAKVCDRLEKRRVDQARRRRAARAARTVTRTTNPGYNARFGRAIRGHSKARG